jgi:hypothetical protein
MKRKVEIGVCGAPLPFKDWAVWQKTPVEDSWKWSGGGKTIEISMGKTLLKTARKIFAAGEKSIFFLIGKM